jgi:hypothetical protein
MHLLLRGLKSSPTLEDFDSDWYERHFLLPLRQIVTNSRIVATQSDDFRTLNKRIRFVCETPGESELYDLFYTLFGGDKLPLKSTNETWVTLLWEENKIRGIRNLCERIQKQKTLSNLSFVEGAGLDKCDFLTKVFQFIFRKDQQKLLYDVQMIPSSRGEFISLATPGISIGEHVTPFMLEVLSELGRDLRGTVVHPSITCLQDVIRTRLSGEEVASQINSQVGSIISTSQARGEGFLSVVKQLWPIMRIVPDGADYTAAFRLKQSKMFYFVSKMAGRTGPDDGAVVNNDIAVTAWKSAHEWCIRALIEEVAKRRSLELFKCHEVDPVEFLNEFYDFLTGSFDESLLDQRAIVPDQNGDFKTRGKVYVDKVDDVFKGALFEVTKGLCLKSQLIHPQIKIATTLTMDMKVLGGKIQQAIATNFVQPSYHCSGLGCGYGYGYHNYSSHSAQCQAQYERERAIVEADKWKFSLLLLHVLPAEGTHNFRRNELILRLSSQLFEAECQPMTRKVLNEDLPPEWDPYVVVPCLDKIMTQVENIGTVQGLSTQVRDHYTVLNDLYEVVKYFPSMGNRKIYPNQCGTFCCLSVLKDGSEIPDQLKDALFTLSFEKTNVRESFVDAQCRPHCVIGRMALQSICELIDGCVCEIHEHLGLQSKKGVVQQIGLVYRDWINGKESRCHFKYFGANEESIVWQILVEKRFRDWLAEVIAGGGNVEEIREVMSEYYKQKPVVGSDPGVLAAELRKRRVEGNSGSLGTEIACLVVEIFGSRLPQSLDVKKIARMFEECCEPGKVA